MLILVSEFLRGNAKTDDCEDLFKQYQVCLKKALRDRNIDKLLDEAREINQENDAEHLRGKRPYTLSPLF